MTETSFFKHLRVKLVLLIFLFAFQVNSMKAQTALRFNLALPVSPFVTSGISGGGFDLGVDTRVFSHSTLRISAHNNKIYLRKNEPDLYKASSTGFKDQLQKNGLRLGFKSYRNQTEEEFGFKGFYLGFFVDLMYARVQYINDEYTHGVRTTREVSFDSKGFFPAAGLNLGYTFNFNNFIIEPNLGVGAAFNTKNFIPEGPSTGLLDFRDIEPMVLHASTWHFELHIGYVF